jgi:TRAP-type C4-dicarboxylate transport system permease small subunit
MGFLEKWIRHLNRILIVTAGVAVAGMIALTVGNIWTRVVWKPIKGSVELIGFFGAVAAAFALGYAQVKKTHIAVDILVLRFPKKVQRFLEGVNALLGAAFFVLAGGQLLRWGTTLWTTGELTETLRIIYHPFVYTVAFGCFVMALVLLLEFLKLLASARRAG